jgi:hypothetical protein
MHRRQAFASRNIKEVLQTAFQDVIRVINYVKNSPLKGRHFAKLWDDMEAEHTVHLQVHYCEIC